MNTGAEPLNGSGAVARRVAVPLWRLLYLIDRGDLPGPSYQVPGRRLFTEEDVLAIARELVARPELRARNKNRCGRPNASLNPVDPTAFH
jgi:hypothetical protein